MQYEKGKELRDSGKEKTCDSHDYEKEYYLGADTGDYICTKCGHTITHAEYRKLK